MKLDGKSLGNIGLVAWVLLAAPIVLLSERAVNSDGPAIRPPSQPSARVVGAGGAEAEGHGKRSRQATEENWAEVEAFMRANSSRKWAAYEKLPPASQTALRAQLIAQYNELTKLAGNSTLHQIELDRVKIEDDIFGSLSDMKRAKSPAEAEKLRPDYLKAVAELIKNRMTERKARWTNLKAMADTLQIQVNSDEAIKNNLSEFNKRVVERARVIETKGLGAGAPARRHTSGQPATSGTEESEVIPNP
jgi:hypothetical protein